MRQLFRKSAVERISSPEQLDKLINISSTRSWIMLIGLFLICVSIVYWICTGKFTEIIEVNGIYMDRVNKTNSYSSEEIFDMKGIECGNQSPVRMYVPLSKANMIKSGMEVMIRPSFLSEQRYGHMNGSVIKVEENGTSKEQLRVELGDEQMVDHVIKECGSEPIIKVVLDINKDSNSVNGYEWSNPQGECIQLSHSMFLDIQVITKKKTAIDYIFGT